MGRDLSTAFIGLWIGRVGPQRDYKCFFNPSFQLWMSSGGSTLVCPVGSDMAELALPSQLLCIPVGLIHHPPHTHNSAPAGTGQN